MELHGVLKNDSCDQYRCSLFEKIRSHFGPLAAEHLKTRLGFASCETVIGWERRAGFMPSYPELLDPAPLAVTYITPALLLKHAFGPAIEKSAVLVRFQRSRDPHHDAWDLRVRAPWFWDLPEADLAIQTLRCHGWLLLACEDDSQAGLLVATVRESKRLVVREITPATNAGESEVARRYLEPLLAEVFDKCLR